LALAAAWVATEALRARVLAQPWGLLGYTQHAHIALLQIAAVTGVYGVSFLLALAGATVADAVVALQARDVRQIPRIVGPPVGLVGTLWLLGAAIVAGGPAGGFGAHTVAIVQTNVPPERDWTRAYTDRQLAAHVEATRTLAAAHPALVVWPEHAVPRYLESEPELGAMLAGLAQRSGADILFGAPRWQDGRTYNSVRLITAAGRNGGAYDKRRLVLFAEHNPLAPDPADARTDDPHQFSAGDGAGVLASFVPLGLTICHEILFPELVTASVAGGAALLVNVSNDGWLDGGHGVASRQHFAMAVLRAVETRRYLVRAATTGVSGVVDPYGRVVGTLAAGATGTLAVPVAGRTRMTPYVRFGDAFALLCSLSAVLALGVRRPALRLRARMVAGGAPAPGTS
jgi:apolipoprotein N-acyltransferase